MLLVACSALSFAWLAVGAVVGVAAHVPPVAAALAAAAAEGNRWARGVLDARAAQRAAGAGRPRLRLQRAHRSSSRSCCWPSSERSWSIRLLVLAMIGSAGAFNLQAHAAATAVETASGLADRRPAPGAAARRRLCGLHPRADWCSRRIGRPVPRGARPHRPGRWRAPGRCCWSASAPRCSRTPSSCVLFFGFLVPLAGLVGAAAPGPRARDRRGAHPGPVAVQRARRSRSRSRWCSRSSRCCCGRSAGPAGPGRSDVRRRRAGQRGTDRAAVLVLPARLHRDRRCRARRDPAGRALDRGAPVQPRAGCRAHRGPGRRWLRRAGHGRPGTCSTKHLAGDGAGSPS